MLINLGWWNTNLSPPKTKGANSTQRLFALSIIRDLLDSGTDVLGLCEVSLDDVKVFEDELGPHGYGVIYAQDSVGKSKFDMAMIYRLGAISCTALGPWTVGFGRRTYRVSYPIEVIVGGTSILIVLTHWPSRLYYPRGDEHRDRIANDMRSKLVDLISAGNEDIILMGDFNDEPHDRNISAGLVALRDRTSAATHQSFFYNPFWNFLGSQPLHVPGTPSRSRSGTYHYKKHQTDRWWTFDQMVFSSAFVGNGKWQLEEEGTMVYEDPNLLSKVLKHGKFDHLPVLSRVRRTL